MSHRRDTDLRPPSTDHDYDLVIVGGGLIGGALACALAPTGLRIAMVEAVAADAADQPSYDERVIALSLGSRRILEGIGLWDAIAPAAEPILRVHVSERGAFGCARLDQAELGVAALGYVTPVRAIGAATKPALAAAPGIEWLCPAQLTGLRHDGNGVTMEVRSPAGTRWLHARLVVAADGGDSAVRQAAGIETKERRYGQDAFITTVTPDRPRTGWAFERFTDTGPLAMLPMTEGRWSVVWSCGEEETEALLALTDDAFLSRLQWRFGFRLGRLARPAPRRAYPLRLRLATETVGQRLVLIGNAAHTLHPVAGQGFNLGLRDVAALAEVLAVAAVASADPGSSQVLDSYREWRGRDQQTTATLTDTLARLFTIRWAAVGLARNVGLLGLDLLPPARRLVARYFMGQVGRTPRLARGLPLNSHLRRVDRPT
jgi:2-octaprenyl-6-methoxyphenol hydroxylase